MNHSLRSVCLCLVLVAFTMAVFAGTVIQREPVMKPAEQPVHAEAFSERSPGHLDVDKYFLEQAERYDRLVAEQAAIRLGAIIRVLVTDEELQAVDNYICETCAGDDGTSTRKERVGIVKPTGVQADFTRFSPRASSRNGGIGANGAVRWMMDGGFVWTAQVVSDGAVALRVHLSDFSLPEGAELYIYNMDGEAFGPYTGRGPSDTGDFWTNSVGGSTAFLQLRLYGRISMDDLRAVSFTVADVAHLGQKFLLPFLQRLDTLPDKSFCSFNAACVQDATCYGTSDYAHIEEARDAVAHMLFVSGAYMYMCSGGLLADTDSSTQIPYFLTANHCISRSSEAASLECYWQFRTSTCRGACYDPVGEVPRTLGAAILSTNKTGDYTLMQLSQNPPAGSVFLGWNSTPVANTNGAALYRISHPQGAPQAFSTHTVNTSAGTCRSWPRGNWIYSRDVIGATEGGSSGSPVLNASGQVVGQLSGACGTNLNDVCDEISNATVDGAFAAYFSNVSQWLNASSGGGSKMHVQSIVLTIKKKGSKYTGVATVTIVDANGGPVAGATVAGAFSGWFTTSASAVTNSSGVAVISSATKTGIGAFGFCVSSVTLTNWTYDSAANAETCDNY